MMDSFHHYIKKQLLEYVEQERKKGIPIEKIEEVLLNAGHGKNIIDEVFRELEVEDAGGRKTPHKDPVEKDLVSMLKQGFEDFMAQASQKEVKGAKKDLKKTDTDKVVEEVIEEAEVIEEKLHFESFTFFVYIIIIGFVILLTAGATDTSVVKVIIGFLPVILNSLISLLGIRLADIVPLFMLIPLVVSSLFYAAGRFASLPLFSGMDIESLAIVNFLLGFLYNMALVYVRFVKPGSMKRRVKKRPKSPMMQRGAQPRQEINELRQEFRI